MNLHHLLLFHTVAEAESISRAAERLLISQPAVSKQLTELERQLGVVLFSRLPRGVRITEAGRVLQGYASRIFSLAEEAQIAVDAVHGVERGRLRIGATTTLGVYLLPDVLVKFRQAHPGVQISLEISHTPTLASWLRESVIDLALTESEVTADGIRSKVIMRDHLVAIAPARHPLGRKRTVTAEQLCREPFVVRETGSHTRSMVEQELAERSLKITPTMSLGSTEAVKHAVIAGVGVAIVSRLAVSPEIAAGRLMLIRVPDLRLSRPIYHVTAAHTTSSPAAKAFDVMLADHVTQIESRTSEPKKKRISGA